MQTATIDTTPTSARRKKICGIYAWEHVPTGMLYIGSSIDCERRKREHQKSGKHFYRRATELGWVGFSFRILEECPPEARLELERDWIQKMDSVHPNGFNIQKDPTRFDNYVWTDEMKLAASERVKITQGTLEARAANSIRMKKWHDNNPQVRVIHSERMKLIQGTPEKRKEHSERMKITHVTPEFRSAQSTRMKSILGTPEARAANSARQKIIKGAPDSRANASVQAKLQFSKPEARANCAARAKAQFSTPEARAAQSVRTKITHNTPEYKMAASMRMRDYYAVNKSHLCKAVNQYTREGEFIATFESATMAARMKGIISSNISKVAKRGGTCGGFRWRYAD